LLIVNKPKEIFFMKDSLLIESFISVQRFIRVARKKLALLIALSNKCVLGKSSARKLATRNSLMKFCSMRKSSLSFIRRRLTIFEKRLKLSRPHWSQKKRKSKWLKTKRKEIVSKH
jgi:hypothetical protein